MPCFRQSATTCASPSRPFIAGSGPPSRSSIQAPANFGRSAPRERHLHSRLGEILDDLIRPVSARSNVAQIGVSDTCNVKQPFGRRRGRVLADCLPGCNRHEQKGNAFGQKSPTHSCALSAITKDFLPIGRLSGLPMSKILIELTTPAAYTIMTANMLDPWRTRLHAHPGTGPPAGYRTASSRGRNADWDRNRACRIA